MHLKDTLKDTSPFDSSEGSAWRDAVAVGIGIVGCCPIFMSVTSRSSYVVLKLKFILVKDIIYIISTDDTLMIHGSWDPPKS